MMRNSKHAEDVFKMINGDSKISILGMNDDIDEDYEETREKMSECKQWVLVWHTF
jgi:3-O-alpha-D-mannopyranosyl-alpha-D-mannopyranose xylosylphosphotransferase